MQVCVLADRLKYYDPVLEKTLDDFNSSLDKENHSSIVEDQKWIQDLKNVLSQYADGNYELLTENNISDMNTNDNSLVSGNYNQPQNTDYKNQIDQQFVDLNQQFSDLNMQYNNYSVDQSDFRPQETQYRDPINTIGFNEPIPTTISTDYNNSINYSGQRPGYIENQPDSISQNEPTTDINGATDFNYGADYYNRNDAAGTQDGGTTADYDYWNQQSNNEVSF